MISFNKFLNDYCTKTEIPHIYLYDGKMYHEDELVAIYEMFDTDEKSDEWWMNY